MEVWVGHLAITNPDLERPSVRKLLFFKIHIISKRMKGKNQNLHLRSQLKAGEPSLFPDAVNRSIALHCGWVASSLVQCDAILVSTQLLLVHS